MPSIATRPVVATLAFALALCASTSLAEPTVSPQAAAWYRAGAKAVSANERVPPAKRRARNVILFIGDGMGMSTITAARIFEGQRLGGLGEDHQLAFERLPHLALSKTYSADQQTADSAPTATAMVTGVKTRGGSLSVDETIARDEKDAAVTARHALQTLLEQAAARGMATGIVTKTRVTDATPASNFAHIAVRDWESDADLPPGATVLDVAAQLIAAQKKYGIEVVLGGGREPFMPDHLPDPEYPQQTGQRRDGRRLIDEWVAAQPASQYVWNRQQFAAVDPKSTRHLLGLFQPSDMQYEADRQPIDGSPGRDPAGEPSLAEMTAKAIAILQESGKGFYLMVEGGRIDHAHHAGNAYRALDDTVALSDAVRTALSMTDMRETLVIVTADHSHVFNLSGYPKRGNPILGFVVEPDATEPALAADGKPYTTVGYLNGPGHADLTPESDADATRTPRAGRHLSPTDPVGARDFYQESLVPLEWETHGGEDVPIYAGGPQAHLFRGTMEQNSIYHVMRKALGF